MADKVPAFWLNVAHWKPFAVVKNANEMAAALKKAPVDVIKHHLRDGKNDFAEWAEKGLGLKSLAGELRSIKAKTPQQILEKTIKAFEKVAEK